MVTMQRMLGSGIYTLREAARYALISPRLMNRWFFGDSKGRRVLSPQFHSGEKLLSFLDFVQTLAIRTSHTVSVLNGTAACRHWTYGDRSVNIRRMGIECRWRGGRVCPG
jgi:hypothetical protein